MVHHCKENNALPLHKEISLQRKRSFREHDENKTNFDSQIEVLQTQINNLRREKASKDKEHETPAQVVNKNPKNPFITQNQDKGVNKDDIREVVTYISSALKTLKQFETKFSGLLSTQ